MEKQKTEQEIREQERQAIIYCIKQMEKSWKDVLNKSEETKKKVAISRIKGMFSGWSLVKDLLKRRKTICDNPKNLEEEWAFAEELKKEVRNSSQA